MKKKTELHGITITRLHTFIFYDSGMHENDMSAILKRLKLVFRDKVYKDRVDESDKRWLDTEIDEVFDGIVKYLNKFL